MVIEEASDGLEAIQKAEKLRPDLILLDIGLPRLNGIAAARKIRSLAPHSRILFLTAHTSPEIVGQALGTGANGYVVKSDAGKELLGASEAVLHGKQFMSQRLGKWVVADTMNTRAPNDQFRTEIVIPTTSHRAESTHWHEVLFYRDETGLLDSFTEFTAAALKAGNAAIVIATESHRASLLQRLQAQDLDLGTAIEQGRYIALDAAETLATFMINDWPDPVRFSKAVGDLMESAVRDATGERRRVAACGECAPLLWTLGNPGAAIRVEQLWDEIARRYDMDTLCGYPSSSFRRDEDVHIFNSICAEHSAVNGKSGLP